MAIRGRKYQTCLNMFETFLKDDPRTRENLLKETTTARLEFLPCAGDFSPMLISCQQRLQPHNSCKMSIPAAQSSSSKTILYVILHSQLRKNYSQPRKILIQATCSRAISRPRKMPSRSIQNFQSGVQALRSGCSSNSFPLHCLFCMTCVSCTRTRGLVCPVARMEEGNPKECTCRTRRELL